MVKLPLLSLTELKEKQKEFENICQLNGQINEIQPAARRVHIRAVANRLKQLCKALEESPECCK